MLHPECRSCGDCKHRVNKRTKTLEYLKFSKGDRTILARQTNMLIMILDGSFTVATEQGEDYVCRKNNMALMMANTNNEVTFLEDSELISISFETINHVCDQASDQVRDIIEDIDYRFRTLEMVDEVVDFSRSLKHYLQDKIECYYIRVSKHLEAFIIFRHYYSIRDICEFFYPAIRQETSLYSQVMAHYKNVNTAAELADACGYKPSNFRRHFKTQFGESPYQWMLKQKAPLIKSRLQDDTVSIKTIVSEFGFADQSHLNNYCKRFFKKTPIEVRRGAQH